MEKLNAEILGKKLKKGEIGVIPTDTIYGIVCSALKEKSVQRVYSARKRSPKKPVIVLISKINDLKKFGIKNIPNTLNKIWPGKVSVVIRVEEKEAIERFKYIHRGKNKIAFRLPKNKFLESVLKISGPLIAPSANLEGKDPSKTILDAKKYFGNNVDFYFGKGTIKSNPSTILEYNPKKSSLKLLREGAVRFVDLKL